MFYDESWMGYGIVGGLQAGLISMLAGLMLFGLFHWLGRRNGSSCGPQIGWSFLLASLLTVSGDLWHMFYLNYFYCVIKIMTSLRHLRATRKEVGHGHESGSTL